MPRSAASNIKYLLLSLLVVVAIVNLTKTSFEILKSSKRLEELKDDISALENQKTSLETDINYKESEDYIEEQARNALNMKKPNEKVYFNSDTLGAKTSNPDTENQENVSYRIAKYLKNISGLSESTVFDFSESGIGADSKTIVGSTRSFVKANYDIKNGNGRAVWFSGRFLSNENKWLLKAMILWASGESYSMDLYEKTVPKYYTRIKYILSGSEDYAIDMKLWTVFR